MIILITILFFVVSIIFFVLADKSSEKHIAARNI
jgi:preprotein translocase subunit SecG